MTEQRIEGVHYLSNHPFSGSSAEVFSPGERHDVPLNAEQLVVHALADQLVTRDAELVVAQQERDAARNEARTDGLTGLLNKRGLNEALRERIASGKPFAYAIVDADRFKRVNDHEGHDVGDLILMDTADTLRSNIRSNDAAARPGGDEFVLLLDLPDGDPGSEEQAEHLAEHLDRIQERLTELAVTTRFEQDHGFGFSVGVAIHKPGNTLQETMRQADMAMYEAKRHKSSGSPDDLR